MKAKGEHDPPPLLAKRSFAVEVFPLPVMHPGGSVELAGPQIPCSHCRAHTPLVTATCAARQGTELQQHP